MFLHSQYSRPFQNKSSNEVRSLVILLNYFKIDFEDLLLAPFDAF